MKILVGYNGSEVAKAALSQAKSYAKTFDALVHVVTSLEGGSRRENRRNQRGHGKSKICPGFSGKRRDSMQNRTTGARPHTRGRFGSICQ